MICKTTTTSLEPRSSDTVFRVQDLITINVCEYRLGKKHGFELLMTEKPQNISFEYLNGHLISVHKLHERHDKTTTLNC